MRARLQGVFWGVVVALAAVALLGGCTSVPVIQNQNGAAGPETISLPVFAAPGCNACDPTAQEDR